MSRSPLLRVLAGRLALRRLRREGLALGDVEVLVAPAGGTKFLLLGGLDRALLPALRTARRGKSARVLHAVGGSIGSWRIAALASSDPAAALERLAVAYIEERRYGSRGSDVPRLPHYCHIAADLVAALLGDESHDALATPGPELGLRLHVLAARCRGLLASDRRAPLLAGLALAAASGLVGRRALGLQLERVVFHTGGHAGPLARLTDVPTHHVRLDGANLALVLRASAAIPLLLKGVTLPEGPPGVVRDAALVDHHPLLDVDVSERGLVLYPHFYPHFRPSFFERALSRRALARRPALDRVVVITPSERYVATLPGGRRPSRSDARRLSPYERARAWREVWRRGDELGEALMRLLEQPGAVADQVEPLVAE